MPPKKAGPGNRQCVGLQCGERSKNEGNLYYSYFPERCDRACKDPSSPLCDRCIKEKTNFEVEGLTGKYHGNYNPNTGDYTIRNPASKLKGSEWHHAMKAKSAAKTAKVATSDAAGGAGGPTIRKTEKAVKEVKKAVSEAVDAAKSVKEAAETPTEVKKARATVSKVKTETNLALEKAKEALLEAKKAAKEEEKVRKEDEKAKKEQERAEREAKKHLKTASKAATTAASAVVEAAEMFSEGRLRRNAATVKKMEKFMKQKMTMNRTMRKVTNAGHAYRRSVPPNTLNPYVKRTYTSRSSNKRASPTAAVSSNRASPTAAAARISNSTASSGSRTSSGSNSTASMASNLGNFGNLAF